VSIGITFEGANLLKLNVTEIAIRKGSLTHNWGYPIPNRKRKDVYESAIKKRLYRDRFLPLQKCFPEREKTDPKRIMRKFRLPPQTRHPDVAKPSTLPENPEQETRAGSLLLPPPNPQTPEKNLKRERDVRAERA
jgi:hypothetical protein